VREAAIVDITDGRDLWSIPLTWPQVVGYICQVS
jgi:hypothetical protein